MPSADAAAPTAKITGQVSGLEGGGLLLSLEGAGTLAVAKNGTFSFDRALPVGAKVHVTVAQQPSKPTQTCAVAGGDGVVGSVSPVITCTTNAYQVKGTLAGLSGGSVTLANNGGDPITVDASGAFAFPLPVASGKTFDVSVKTQPSGPSQICHVTGGSGTIVAADVATVVVNCNVNKFSVGGSVSGLAGTLEVRNGSAAPIAITANGNFAFPVTVDSGQPYAVVVDAQPSDPHQTCLITNDAGVVGGLDVVNVSIACTTNRYPVRGTVSGLVVGGSATPVVLHDTAGGTVEVAANGPFTLPATIFSNAPYAVTVSGSPTHPWQTCLVTAGSGVVRGGAITDVAVTCTVDRFPVSATVTGLSGTGLVLHDRAGQSLAIASDGPQTFAATVASGDSYEVTVEAQPASPTQTCSVTAGAGTVASGAITDIAVNCSTDSFTVGGTVAGLDGQVTITNGGVDLVLTSNGEFALPAPIASGQGYALTVKTNPTLPAQLCAVVHGSGIVGAANVSDVTITCATSSFTVGGTVSGLLGAPLQLGLGADVLDIASDGAFTFPTSIASALGYSASVLAQPTNPWQTCSLTGDSGQITSGNVTDLAVTCVTNRYNVGGSVSGLLGSGLALAGSGLSTTINGDGSFQFSTTLASGASFDVAITQQPTNPSQTCTIGGNSGTLGGADVSTIALNCTTNMYSVRGTVTGLQGTVTLSDGGGYSQDVTSNGDFSFAVPIASGGGYSVEVLANPSSPIAQTCIVGNGSGLVGSADVADVTITCTTRTFAVGGSVSGLGAGEQVVLSLNGGAQAATVLANGAFGFPSALDSGSAYAVTVSSGPVNKLCTVSSGSGTVHAADITNVSVSCAVRSVRVGSGPGWYTSPTTYSCLEACAHVFGGASTDYSCSVAQDSITHTAWLSGYGSDAHCDNATPAAEDFKAGVTYGPGAYSAYIADHCSMSVNYCFLN